MKIAVITGASSGIGMKFAEKIDELRETDEIWLVARRENRLSDLAARLKTSARVFALDLTNRENIEVLTDAFSVGDIEIKYLVNAAGFGKFGDWSEVSVDDANGMIELNDKALVDITLGALQYMKRGSHIIEMCSISAYLPLENFAVYSASKAFVLNFSYALRAEVKRKGITVTAVCAGWVDTEFAAVAHNGADSNGPKRLKPMTSPEKVVGRAIKAANKNKPVSIYGFYWKCMHVATKLFPKRMSMYFWHLMQKRK